jgi:hypothetical protein
MFLTLFVVLLVMWMLGFFAFHVAGGADSPVANHCGNFLGDAPV